MAPPVVWVLLELHRNNQSPSIGVGPLAGPHFLYHSLWHCCDLFYQDLGAAPPTLLFPVSLLLPSAPTSNHLSGRVYFNHLPIVAGVGELLLFSLTCSEKPLCPSLQSAVHQVVRHVSTRGSLWSGRILPARWSIAGIPPWVLWS